MVGNPCRNAPLFPDYGVIFHYRLVFVGCMTGFFGIRFAKAPKRRGQLVKKRQTDYSPWRTNNIRLFASAGSFVAEFLRRDPREQSAVGRFELTTLASEYVKNNGAKQGRRLSSVDESACEREGFSAGRDGRSEE